MRKSGILLPIFSLDGVYGIGEIGCHAREFVAKLALAGQKSWQILPVGPTGYGNSPYQALSSYAGNDLLISFDDLIEQGLLSQRKAAPAQTINTGQIDYQRTIPIRTQILDQVAQGFIKNASAETKDKFAKFCEKHAAPWLDDYALFCIIKQVHKLKPWYQWPSRFKNRDLDTLRKFAADHAVEILHIKIRQFLFFYQWTKLRKNCTDHGIELIGDIPIFISHDSVESWCNPELFFFDAKGRCTVIAGVPPDYFSKTGQRWGNPLYRWEVHRQQNFQWWFNRLDHMLEMVDVLRIDHFRGFQAYWEIPADEKTAIKGQWIEAPGYEMFAQYQEHNPNGQFIAEDLGVITEEVEKLRDDFEFPGMRVLQFAFDCDPKNIHLPDQCPINSVAYTSTHDNDTLRGWLESERLHKLIAKRLDIPKKKINTWQLIRQVILSPANRAIFPLQDILDLDTTARTNMPSTMKGNWQWRYTENMLDATHINRLRELTQKALRI